MGPESAVELARKLFEELYFCLGQGYPMHPSDVAQAADALLHSPDVSLRSLLMDVIEVPVKGRRVTPKSLAQKRYVDTINALDVVFGVGPAGTGKT
ncbi:MAG: PhoH family protein, partial [Myxococcales bacterium]|nr:PhoH family protein [Myxococcales bacterium]